MRWIPACSWCWVCCCARRAGAPVQQLEVGAGLLCSSTSRHPAMLCCVRTCRIPKEKYFPVPGVDGALVTFKLLPPAQRLQVPDERGFISMVGDCDQTRLLSAGRPPLPQLEPACAGRTCASGCC